MPRRIGTFEMQAADIPDLPGSEKYWQMYAGFLSLMIWPSAYLSRILQ